jgi:hypothetical protein
VWNDKLLTFPNALVNTTDQTTKQTVSQPTAATITVWNKNFEQERTIQVDTLRMNRIGLWKDNIACGLAGGKIIIIQPDGTPVFNLSGTR